MIRFKVLRTVMGVDPRFNKKYSLEVAGYTILQDEETGGLFIDEYAGLGSTGPRRLSSEDEEIFLKDPMIQYILRSKER